MAQTEDSLLARVDELLADAKTGILATIDEQGRPVMRWMTPGTMKGRRGCLFAITSEKSAKVRQLRNNPQVQWMIQSRNLDRVVVLRGKVNIVESASLKMEVFEQMGRRLRMAWRVNVNPEECVVLETVLEDGVWYEPMKDVRETVRFGEGERSGHE
ncbi:MAG: pyridoxamine 5'-phosphate oxidase family protein [Phycisphaerae bacterium]|jgi:general stress protein 26|nr:pyridoxamine 5'-phosphate oxidase family protein [Phycisphaerae bacterium]